jgi:hypothetical protein
MVVTETGCVDELVGTFRNPTGLTSVWHQSGRVSESASLGTVQNILHQSMLQSDGSFSIFLPPSVLTSLQFPSLYLLFDSCRPLFLSLSSSVFNIDISSFSLSLTFISFVLLLVWSFVALTVHHPLAASGAPSNAKLIECVHWTCNISHMATDILPCRGHGKVNRERPMPCAFRLAHHQYVYVYPWHITSTPYINTVRRMPCGHYQFIIHRYRVHVRVRLIHIIYMYTYTYICFATNDRYVYL